MSLALDHLAGILSDLVPHRPRKLKFVVGDGIAPVTPILSPRRVRECLRALGVRRPTKAQEASFRWTYYEYARFHTANSCPAFGYYLLYHLTQLGYVDCIVTTNYDLYFDSIAERLNRIWLINPSAGAADYLWEGYRSRSSRRRPRVWKIHGTLSHATFLQCSVRDEAHIFRLPKFLVSRDTSEILTTFPFTASHDYVPHIGRRHHVVSLQEPEAQSGLASHFLDWAFSNKRLAFKREIQAAVEDLSAPNTAAVVLIGFTGYYDRSNLSDPFNEELVPIIRALSCPVFYFTSEQQASRLEENPSPVGSLYRQFRRSRDRHDTYKDSGECLARVVELARLDTASTLRRAYYWDWLNGHRFMPRELLAAS